MAIKGQEIPKEDMKPGSLYWVNVFGCEFYATFYKTSNSFVGITDYIFRNGATLRTPVVDFKAFGEAKTEDLAEMCW